MDSNTPPVSEMEFAASPGIARVLNPGLFFVASTIIASEKSMPVQIVFPTLAPLSGVVNLEGWPGVQVPYPLSSWATCANAIDKRLSLLSLVSILSWFLVYVIKRYGCYHDPRYTTLTSLWYYQHDRVDVVLLLFSASSCSCVFLVLLLSISARIISWTLTVWCCSGPGMRGYCWSMWQKTNTSFICRTSKCSWVHKITAIKLQSYTMNY